MARMWYALLCTTFMVLAAHLYIQLLQQPGKTFTDLAQTLLDQVIDFLESPVYIEVNNETYVVTMLPRLAFIFVILFLLRTLWTMSNNIASLNNQMAMMEKKISQLSGNAVSHDSELGDLNELVQNLSASVMDLKERMSFIDHDCQTTEQKMTKFISKTFMQFVEKYTKATETLTTKITETKANSETVLHDLGRKLTDLLQTLDTVTLNVKSLDDDNEYMKGRMACFRDLLQHLKKYIPAPEFRIPSHRRIKAPPSAHSGNKSALKHPQHVQRPTVPHTENKPVLNEQASPRGDGVYAPQCKPATPGAELSTDDNLV